MKDFIERILKYNTESVFEWLLNNIVFSVVPVVFAIIWSFLANDGEFEISGYIRDFILLMLTVAINLYALNNKSRQSMLVKVITIAITFSGWTIYVIMFVKGIAHGSVIACSVCIVIFLVCTIYGCKIAYEKDKRKTELEQERKENCKKLLTRVTTENKYIRSLETNIKYPCCESANCKNIINNLDVLDDK